MKIKCSCFFIILTFFASSKAFCQSDLEKIFSLDLVTSSSVDFDFQKSESLYSEEDSSQKSSYQFSDPAYGGKLHTPLYDFCFYQKADSINTGISIFTNSVYAKVPVTLKIGNLSSSGGFSKLKSPLLTSSSSPFSQAKSSIENLSVSLPGYSSFGKPVTMFSQIEFLKIPFLSDSKLNFFWSPEEDFQILNLCKKIKINKKDSLSINLLSGLFSYEENNFSSWFSTSEKFYKSGNHICSSIQLLYKSTLFSTLDTVSIFQSPFNKINLSFKSENKLKTSNFTFNLSAFYNPTEIFTADEKSISPCFQTKFNTTYNFKLTEKRPLFFKTGISFYTKINLEEESHIFNLGTGLQITSLLSTFSLTDLISSEVENSLSQLKINFSSFNLQLKESLYFPKINPVFAAAFTYKLSDSDSKTFTHKYSLNLNFNQTQKILFSSAFSQTLTDLEVTKNNISTSIKFNLSRKNVHYTLKFGMDVAL